VRAATKGKASLADQRADFRENLLGWYRRNARPLPWRTEGSVYRTVVSEFMLQQTQVKTVLPYFERWMGLFPDFATLASAKLERVLKAWEGLGYYARARNLHRLASAVAALESPPQTPDEWLALPGIGPYTAAAICSIAFGRAVACIDGNVVRILARLTADATEYRDGASAAKAMTRLANELMEDCAVPGDYNQAMMELGATLCTKANPQCGLCPVRAFCRGADGGTPELFPNLKAKAITAQAVVRIWCRRGNELLLHRHHAQAARLAGLYELPTAEQAGLTDTDAQRGRLVATRRRAITRYQITEYIHEAEGPPGGAAELEWVKLAELGRVALSGPHRRWVGELLGQGKGRPAAASNGECAGGAASTVTPRPAQPRP
jgi:A/G-specific adenine glycosylase